MAKLDQILHAAQELNSDERLTLARHLLTAGDAEPPDEVERDWDIEIRERIARYDRGEAKSRPVGEVFAELDRRLGS